MFSGRFSKSDCSVRQTSSVQDRVVQENASVVSSFFGVLAFWAASYAAFSQNCPQTPYVAVTVDQSAPATSHRRELRNQVHTADALLINRPNAGWRHQRSRS